MSSICGAEGIAHDGLDRDGSYGRMRHADVLAQQASLLLL